MLEAAYLLAITKSNRASIDHELVHNEPKTTPGLQAHAQIISEVKLADRDIKLQVDFTSTDTSNLPVAMTSIYPRDPTTFHKTFQVNGIKRRPSAVVGILNAVMFGAEDLELVYGSPSVRRRYIDILISQVNEYYLKSLQRYHKVLTQRNHLLKSIRQKVASVDQLEYWDNELVSEGSVIIEERAKTLTLLSDMSDSVHSELSGRNERLELLYRPSIMPSGGMSTSRTSKLFSETLNSERPREIAKGFTAHGPHRDDIEHQISGMKASTYASRGQIRTAVLAMKLAEAEFLKHERGQEPVLLLDDVLSELDPARRGLVLDRASKYQQCLITTAEPGSINPERLSQMHRFKVTKGAIEPISITN